ncbi:aminoglycoside phosphotransferase family protein [Aspergillus thermomutatus]|uniref:Aminoglycoside phosphotransferase domain-containing protein n=1 Tax=Aspergillus thermomutatus TaxID=41047 RepID=A0A397GE76_ASPTH|nr:uncharacterized protein CDV56_105865 [Aspergillus thermomutatus]RHZ48757.1 hypothetical protein CDV56_105865 [Aspergillus thermomutatus]
MIAENRIFTFRPLFFPFGQLDFNASVDYNTMIFHKPSPPIEVSVSKLDPDTYQMGSKFLCKKATNGIPKTAVATWTEDDGQYYLVEATSANSLEKAADGLIYQAGMSSAVWEIGTHAICKVKTWSDGMERESNTLSFVASRFPHIPIPEVIYSWVDEQLSRTFLILRRVQGQTLASAWPTLTLEKKADVAITVAQYCRDLAEATSEKLQSATGCGVLEPFLTVDPEDSHPSWKPRPLGPFSRTDAEKYFLRISTMPLPPIGDRFHFYHADLGPTNILLSDDGTIEAILDWESAGYYPKFWIPLKPYRSGGFNLDVPDDSRYDWTDLLESKLSDVGFKLHRNDVEWQKSLAFTFFDLDELRDAPL